MSLTGLSRRSLDGRWCGVRNDVRNNLGSTGVCAMEWRNMEGLLKSPWAERRDALAVLRELVDALDDFIGPSVHRVNAIRKVIAIRKLIRYGTDLSVEYDPE